MKATLKITIETEAGTEMYLEISQELDKAELDEIVAAGREIFELEGDEK